MKTRKTILSMALITALSMAIAACGNGSAPINPDGTSSDDGSVTTAPADGLSFIPEGTNYNGEEVKIMYAHVLMSDSENEVTYTPDELDGDIISDAVYKRTTMAEEKLGVKITSEHLKDYGTLPKVIEQSIMADDNRFDAVVGRLQVMVTASSNGHLLNLKNIKTLDLSNQWWDPNVNDCMDFGGVQNIASGDINYCDDYSINVIFFNKKLFEAYGIEEPYQLVRDGTWTFDKLLEMQNGAAVDLNGDGKYDENDEYGMVSSNLYVVQMLVGFGNKVVIRDNDEVVMNRSQKIIEQAIEVVDKAAKRDNNSVIIEERKMGYEKGDALFPNGQTRMYLAPMGQMLKYRQTMEDPFGVLPIPKYDEAQDNYYSAVNQYWASCVSVPLNCKDTDRIGYVLETMGYYSPETVTKAVIEKSIIGKATRDEETGEMLELIFKSKVFDPGLVYEWGANRFWYDIGDAGKSDIIMSRLEKKYDNINARISESIAGIKSQQ